ncbi:3-dehydroquinate synthase [Halobacteroides halobius DSM 5150]|uniref:3-dehydroquinate synthase n=1 Tax=Halobacteroides halobius (strain ATCC 35273 / DSM 5150 / MD-1) TaxID=748449 RepID=L0K5E9_HALHC|nr:3-dehydroquinate synthase [Halobacteroides halobius]AGB40502.1 3-dehydroquinate synthase [Halobacteroides halobius DSM 5150]
METVKVDLGVRSYQIKIGEDILANLGAYLQELDIGSKVLIITNPLVNSLYGSEVKEAIAKVGFDVSKALISDGEEYKSLETAQDLYDKAVGVGLDRTSTIVALGGGVVGDIAGFIAASFMRGINFVQVPTTVLAQVDSSVGGKVAVNHPQGKNLIGDFYQPKLVVADKKVLSTLEERELKAGLAEVIKYGVIWDQQFFAFLEKRIDEILNLETDAIIKLVTRSCEIKAAVVAEDEKEEGLRAILNYGHTIGHALEAVTNYKKYRHGEAVAIGMVAAAKLAYKRGLLDSAALERQKELISNFGLPVAYHNLEKEQIIKALSKDKKVKNGVIRFILANQIGKVIITSDLTEENIRETLEELGG